MEDSMQCLFQVWKIPVTSQWVFPDVSDYGNSWLGPGPFTSDVVLNQTNHDEV